MRKEKSQKFGAHDSKQLISAETAQILRKMMISVTQEGGTAVEAAIPGYNVAGKTGTSQVFDEKTGRYSNRKHIAFSMAMSQLNSHYSPC